MSNIEKSQSNEQAPPLASELPQDVQAQLLRLGLQIGNNGYIVWRKDNPAHPRNWSGRRKAFDVGLIVLFDLFAFVLSQTLDYSVIADIKASQDRHKYSRGNYFSLLYYSY